MGKILKIGLFAIVISGSSLLTMPQLIMAHRDGGKSAGQIVGTGVASFYGAKFAGKRTANGERFDPSKMTAAHRKLRFGTKVRVTNLRNGRQVVVRINDRGPWTGGRIIDLSRAAAREIGMIRSGTARVRLERIR